MGFANIARLPGILVSREGDMPKAYYYQAKAKNGKKEDKSKESDGEQKSMYERKFSCQQVPLFRESQRPFL